MTMSNKNSKGRLAAVGRVSSPGRSQSMRPFTVRRSASPGPTRRVPAHNRVVCKIPLPSFTPVKQPATEHRKFPLRATQAFPYTRLYKVSSAPSLPPSPPPSYTRQYAPMRDGSSPRSGQFLPPMHLARRLGSRYSSGGSSIESDTARSTRTASSGSGSQSASTSFPSLSSGSLGSLEEEPLAVDAVKVGTWLRPLLLVNKVMEDGRAAENFVHAVEAKLEREKKIRGGLGMDEKPYVAKTEVCTIAQTKLLHTLTKRPTL